MSCKDPLNDCGPCQDCNEPAPVLPLCDFPLPDGTFTNATVTIEGGCITVVASGDPPQYTPDQCCEPTGGGGTCDCEDGLPGEDGEAADIVIGTVTTLAAGSNATVSAGPGSVSNGTGGYSHLVLDFGIPRGADGTGGSGGGGGVTNSTAGIVITDGLVTALPTNWPPALSFTATASPAGVILTVLPPDPLTGNVAINLDLSVMSNRITTLESAVTSMQTDITTLQTTIANLQTQLNTCCPP